MPNADAIDQAMMDVHHALKSSLYPIVALSRRMLESDLSSRQRQDVHTLHRLCIRMERTLETRATLHRMSREPGPDWTRHLTFPCSHLRQHASEAVYAWAPQIGPSCQIVLDDCARHESFVLPCLLDTVPATVVWELVSNAASYSFPATPVTIRIRRNFPAGISFTVSSLGVPISEDELPHVIERGFRGHAAGMVHPAGTGMGLHAVHTLMSAVGGTFAITSVSTGIGVSRTDAQAIFRSEPKE